MTAPWNDIDRATEVLATGTVAAVLAEPFLGAGGVIPAAPGFLAAAKAHDPRQDHRRPNHVAHAGTFNGHLAAVVAGLVTLEELDASSISNLNTAAASLAAQVTAASEAAGIDAEVSRAGSILNLHLADPAFSTPVHLALLLEGVYTTPRGM